MTAVNLRLPEELIAAVRERYPAETLSYSIREALRAAVRSDRHEDANRPKPHDK